MYLVLGHKGSVEKHSYLCISGTPFCLFAVCVTRPMLMQLISHRDGLKSSAWLRVPAQAQKGTWSEEQVMEPNSQDEESVMERIAHIKTRVCHDKGCT